MGKYCTSVTVIPTSHKITIGDLTAPLMMQIPVSASERAVKWSKCSATITHLVNLDGVPGSSLPSGQALTLVMLGLTDDGSFPLPPLSIVLTFAN